MNTLTLPLINKLVEERLHLYELASNGALPPEQRYRIAEITDRLPGLWDQYRRELAAQHGPAVRLTGAEKLQQSLAADWSRAERVPKAA